MFRHVLVVALAWLAMPAAAHADGGQCVAVHVQFTPTDSLQIVAWVEDAQGHYIDTVYITRKTGLYGMGNRPGRFDYNSGPPPDPASHIDDLWPYGRRVSTFPVWAHRHGMSFPEVVFQDGNENNLSHSSQESSRETTYCRPVDPSVTSGQDPIIWDTGTCATLAYTDKGKLSTTQTSLYPPRSDLVRDVTHDTADVLTYAAVNPFDTISQATPAGGAPVELVWSAPPNLSPGAYVLWVEVSRERDFNASYNFPSPTGIPWQTYGNAYRGQPSVVYSAPFSVGHAASTGSTQDYVGYGAADGNDGVLHPPDSTITTGTPGSGASRLELISDGGNLYRLRVDAIPVLDFIAPDAPAELAAEAITGADATLRFVAPGDDGQIGTVSGYEVRIRANDEMNATNFDDSMPTGTTIAPAAAGAIQELTVGGLLPETDYWIGVRAFDDCHNASAPTVLHITTADRQSGVVDACFIATAAYGSIMANDVTLLRRFRDAVLARSVLGELAIETYYTFGPPVAGTIGESDLLRTTARAVLAPIVARVRTLSPG